MTSPTTYTTSTFNTVWINANGFANPASVSGDNIFNSITKNGILGGYKSLTWAAPTATFNVYVPNSIVPVNSNTFLYCRIGLPMNQDISFQYISVTIS